MSWLGDVNNFCNDIYVIMQNFISQMFFCIVFHVNCPFHLIIVLRRGDGQQITVKLVWYIEHGYSQILDIAMFNRALIKILNKSFQRFMVIMKSDITSLQI